MKKSFYFLTFLVLILVLSSCYSTVLTSTHGVPNPDFNERKDFFRDKFVVEFDTVLKAGATIDYTVIKTRRKGCPSGKLHSVEFKNSFGGVMLYLVTLGSRRKVSIKYTCMQDL
jgi:hypothetical protein